MPIFDGGSAITAAIGDVVTHLASGEIGPATAVADLLVRDLDKLLHPVIVDGGCVENNHRSTCGADRLGYGRDNISQLRLAVVSGISRLKSGFQTDALQGLSDAQRGWLNSCISKRAKSE